MSRAAARIEPLEPAPSRRVGLALYAPRLRLRPITASDADAVRQLAGAWAVARMLADMPHPLSLAAALHWCRSAADEGVLAIEAARVEKGGGLIGAVSLSPLDDGAAELGFWLGISRWGRGVAREAARLVIAQALADDPGLGIVSGHFVDNPASARVLAALGFVETGPAKAWCLARSETLAAVRYRLDDARYRAEAH